MRRIKNIIIFFKQGRSSSALVVEEKIKIFEKPIDITIILLYNIIVVKVNT